VIGVRTSRQGNRKIIVESVAFGLGYAAVLIWIGSAFVGSFGDFDDAYPYWPAIPGLRTLPVQLSHLAPWPTEGTVRVIALAVCLVTSAFRRYLRATDGPVSQQPATTPEKADISV